MVAHLQAPQNVEKHIELLIAPQAAYRIHEVQRQLRAPAMRLKEYLWAFFDVLLSLKRSFLRMQALAFASLPGSNNSFSYLFLEGTFLASRSQCSTFARSCIDDPTGALSWDEDNLAFLHNSRPQSPSQEMQRNKNALRRTAADRRYEDSLMR